MNGKPTHAEGRRQPSYRSVVAALRAAIRDGQLGPNGRLPTETELVDRHRVSRGTVRRAYLELVSEGAVKRFPGKGTFVAPDQPYRRLFGSIDELLALSLDTVMEVLAPFRTVSDSDAAAALGLQFDEVLRVTYRRLHADVPFCYTEVYLPPQMAEHLAGSRFLHQKSARSEQTVLGILDRVLPHPIVGARQTVTAVALPDAIARYIDCAGGDPAMRIERVHFDAVGRPAERCVNYFNPDRYVYRIQLQRHQPHLSPTDRS
jgi:DNA-binding GntR family transcriptional regulator